MPRAGGTRRPKSGASAGGKGKPKAKGNKSRTIKDVKNTPPGKTSDTRNSNARQELESLIGLRICLVTNMMTCPYLVHGIHIVSRRLPSSHKELVSGPHLLLLTAIMLTLAALV